MGRPVVNGRKFIHERGNIIGICLGHGGYAEHHIDNTEFYVQRFNKCNTILSRLSNPFVANCNTLDIEQILLDYKADEKFLKKIAKENKNTLYAKYVDYILRPNLHVYERELTIDNSAFVGTPGLCSGEYVYLAIEGMDYCGTSESMLEKKLGSRNECLESDIFSSGDYSSSRFHTPDLFMSSWACNEGVMNLIVDKQIANGILSTIKQSLKSGYLALVYGYNGNEALSLIFVDELMKVGEHSLSGIISTTQMNLF